MNRLRLVHDKSFFALQTVSSAFKLDLNLIIDLPRQFSLTESMALLRLHWCDYGVSRCWAHATSPLQCWIAGFVKFVARVCQVVHVYIGICQTPSWNLTRILNLIHSWQICLSKIVDIIQLWAAYTLRGNVRHFLDKCGGGGHSDVAGLSWVANDGPITPAVSFKILLFSWLNAQVCLVYTH